MSQVNDADPGPRDPCVVAAIDKRTGTTESCGDKGKALVQPVERRALGPWP